jgi:tetratricopeptide (TPR) repeat protein
VDIRQQKAGRHVTRLSTSAMALLVATALAMPAAADGVAGAYLASRHAGYSNDFDKAAEYASRALMSDPRNAELMASALSAYIGQGRFDRAAPFAERMADAGASSQMGNLVLLAEMARNGDWDGIVAARLAVAPVVDGLARGWAEVGAGRMSEALKAFDEVAGADATRAFGLYHRALALALAGDYEAADAILSSRQGETLNLSRRGVVARVEVLSQLEKNDEARSVLAEAFGADLDPALADMDARLAAGETLPLTVVTSATDGFAEILYGVAAALNRDTPQTFVLAFSRAAEALRPGHVDALLLSASVLEELHRYDLAIDTYDLIPADSAYFHIAELGRANALDASGQPDEAIRVLQRLTVSHDTVPGIFVTLGDSLRRQERYAEAGVAYDRAIALYATPDESQWQVYFARGITQEREKNWDRAEADFRKALELKPGQPQVLNYLGYSFVEMQRNMDEALGMIEQAVKERPDDGYITDSLGWVFYRMGRYDEAVVQMERAAALEPVDPVVNDHLGDVYWAVGRKREAEFQWRRAMSFDPEEPDITRIRRKLEVGLDVVLQEEGAEPLAVATDG